MKLLGIQLSPFVRKVSVVLTVKELAFEQEPMMPGDTGEEFRAMSPLGKIPVLVDGDVALADSSVICEYLDEKYPAHPVMPKDPESRARARFLEEYGDSKLIEAASVIFREKFLNPTMFGQETDMARVSEVEDTLLPPLLDYLEGQVPPEGYLFGDFCTADISIVTPIFNAAFGGYEVDVARWPRYAAFVRRVAEHPAVIKVRNDEQQLIAQMKGG